MQNNANRTLLAEAGLSAATSEHAFALWGVDEVAYIKLVWVEQTPAWVIYAADGTTLAVLPNRDLAFAAAIQNDRTPLSVH